MYYKSELAEVVMIKSNRKPVPIYTRDALIATGVLLAYLNQ